MTKPRLSSPPRSGSDCRRTTCSSSARGRCPPSTPDRPRAVGNAGTDRRQSRRARRHVGRARSAAAHLDDIERRGIRHLFYFQVDNPLVDICGREFVGYHLLAGSEFSTQVIAKRDPLDRVGNVVQVDGRLMVIEYSDLPDDAARRRNPDGSLAIWAGSIAVHVMDTAFLRRLAGTADGLPFHIAQKKVIAIDPFGKDVQPRQHNAIKFERFIFDLMPQARQRDRGGGGSNAGVRPAEERRRGEVGHGRGRAGADGRLARGWLRRRARR